MKFQVKGPLSEEETVAAFAEHGIEYEVRADRYNKLRGTMFESAPARYYIAYAPDLNGKPVAVQGIAPYESIYLLSGLKSYAGMSGLPEEQTKGAGRFISEKVVDLHSNRPIVGYASEKGLPVFTRQGFNEIEYKDGKTVGQEDIPDDVLRVLEGVQGGSYTSIRKLFYRPAVKWFYYVRKE
ncbi:MAG: hypothetical protein VXX39_05175 [Candidatus Thermoplasmatota archaeon]|nr:hypothetical protein [Candidatus Thermoplasmatota archaeon]